MSQIPSSSRLLSLPTDIHQLIVAAFNAPTPLFAPIYELNARRAAQGYRDLPNKHKEYYGTRDGDSSSEALLSLSLTCKLFRELLAPILFHDIILRPNPKSMSSVALLATTPHWHYVKSLTFASMYAMEKEYLPSEDESDNNEGDLNTEKGESSNEDTDLDPPDDEDKESNNGIVDPLKVCDFEELSTLISNLPPNLQRLSLDFATDWISEESDGFAVLQFTPSVADTLSHEVNNLWRKLTFVVLNAVVDNDWTLKEKFELKLLNLSPLFCSVYWSKKFESMLRHVTDLNLGFGHLNGDEIHMNEMQMPGAFCSSLGSWFWNHLQAATTLQIHADKAWPIGLAPGKDEIPLHVPLALPQGNIRLTQLQKLDLKWFLIDNKLITFVTVHMPNLKQFNIASYCADCPSTSSSLAPNRPSWADFFTALADHPSLRELTFYPHLSEKELLNYEGPIDVLLDNTDAPDRIRVVWKQTMASERLRAERFDDEKLDVRAEARVKRMWPYGHLWYGEEDTVYFDIGFCILRYSEGRDHAAWLGLCDVMEERGGYCTVVDIVDHGINISGDAASAYGDDSARNCLATRSAIRGLILAGEDSDAED